MLSSKGNMLSCMILLTTELDARMQLLACIQYRAVVDAPEQDYMLSCIIFKLDARGHYSSSIH